MRLESLPGGGQIQRDLDDDGIPRCAAVAGRRILFQSELAQGFGLNGTLGLAGFSNGEAQKAGAPFPKFRPQRYYLKQTFGLGGEQEDVADAAEPARRASATSTASR